MKIIVTGHKGFIGSNLKKELEKKYEVVGVEIEDLPNLSTILHDTKPNAIFHVGACSDTLNEQLDWMMETNWESTVLISNYCSQVNIPLIYSSTAAIYGDLHGYKNLYAWSKYTAEQHVVTNKQIALRYFNVYGPGEEHKGKMASVAYQSFTKHNNSVPVKLFPLNPRRDFVYIKDVVDANLFALKNYFKLEKKYYDVGVGKEESFEYVMDIMEIPYTYTEASEIPKNYQFNTVSNKDRWLKSWKPKYDLEKGLKEYKDYLCKSI